MTEQERAEKLRAQMSRWQTYVENPQTTPEEAGAQDTEHSRRPLTTPNYDAPARRIEGKVHRPSGNSPAPEPVMPARIPGPSAPPPGATQQIIALHEAHIAELQTAIEYERERSRRLAEEIAREQALHAFTMRTRDRSPAPTEPPFLPDQQPEWYSRIRHYEEERRAKLFTWFSVLLLITGLCGVLGFWFTR